MKHNSENCEIVAQRIVDDMTTDDLMGIVIEQVYENLMDDRDTFDMACEDFGL